MRLHTAPALLLLALSAVPASAAIIGVTGNTTWLGSPPASCGPGALMGLTAFAWDEQQNIPLTGVYCDMINNPGNSGSPIPGSIAGLFDSHFIHFQGQPGVISANGTVSFNGPIIGVIYLPNSLDNTDGSCGAFSTLYPTTYPLRGLTTAIPSFCSILGNTITFNLNTLASAPEVGQIRVLTHPAPAPGSLAVLGLAGLACRRRRR